MGFTTLTALIPSRLPQKWRCSCQGVLHSTQQYLHHTRYLVVMINRKKSQTTIHAGRGDRTASQCPTLHHNNTVDKTVWLVNLGQKVVGTRLIRHCTANNTTPQYRILPGIHTHRQAYPTLKISTSFTQKRGSGAVTETKQTVIQAGIWDHMQFLTLYYNNT